MNKLIRIAMFCVACLAVAIPVFVRPPFAYAECPCRSPQPCDKEVCTTNTCPIGAYDCTSSTNCHTEHTICAVTCFSAANGCNQCCWDTNDSCHVGINGCNTPTTGDDSTNPPVGPSCGDGTCNGAEACDTCPGDCGACPATTGTVNARAVLVPASSTACTDVTGSTDYLAADFLLAPGVPNPPGAAQSALADGTYASWAGIPVNETAGTTYFLAPSVSSEYVERLACWSRNMPAGSGTGTAATLTADGSSLTWNIGYTLGFPWVQAEGGDVYSAGALRSYVPPGIAPRVFLRNGITGGYPGVATYGSSYDFASAFFEYGEAYISSTNWLVNATNAAVDYYDYFYRRFGAPTTPTTDTAFSNPLAVTKPSSSATPYYVVGDMTTSATGWTVGNSESIVIIVDGNLTIGGDIRVGTTGFLAFIVKGNITVDSSVGGVRGSTEPNIEGIYITSPTGTFITGESTGLTSASLVGRGMFIAGDFLLQRDLGDYGTNAYPAEYFIYDPKYLMTMPDAMKDTSVTWQEVAP